jgi:MFS family permease
MTLGIVTVVTLIAFEAMAVASAMPVVAQDLDAVREYGLAFTMFLIPLLLGVVVSGGWSDARGPSWPIRAGLLLFGGGLVVSGLATSLAVLLVGRALAGTGGGLLIVALYVVIAEVYPTSVQPRVFSYLSAGWVLPSLIGPALAGWLAEDVTWRAVFLLVPPLTVPPALALVPRVSRLGPAPGAGETAGAGPSVRVRVLSGVAVSVGVGVLQWGLDGVSRDSGNATLAGAAVAAGLVLVGTSLPRLLPKGALRLGRGLPTAVVMRGLFAATFFGAETFIPLMLVSHRGIAPTEAGLVLSAGAIGWTGGAFLQSRSWVTMPRHVMLFTGGLVIGLGQLALVLVVGPELPTWTAIPIWIVVAFGMGLGMSTTSVLTLRLSKPGEQGRNSSGLQLSDSLGSALGIGLTGAAFAAWHDPAGDDGPLYVGIWVATAAFALVAALVGLRAKPREGWAPTAEPVAEPERVIVENPSR